MDIRSINYRTIGKPIFNMQECNAILDFLRQSSVSKKGIQSSYGSLSIEDTAAPSTISVRNNTGINLDLFSVFGVKIVDRNFAPHQAYADIDLDFNMQTLKQNAAIIWCTNGGRRFLPSCILNCEVFGYAKPLLVKYTSTAPVMGQRMQPIGNPQNKFKAQSSGNFVAVSKPNAADTTVWVVRHSKSEFIYGKAAANISYGAKDGVINIWRNEEITDPLETEGVWFTWEGSPGQTIPAGAKMTAKWIDDINAYRVFLSNCVAS